MSDSGRSMADCRHGNWKNGCRQCVIDAVESRLNEMGVRSGTIDERMASISLLLHDRECTIDDQRQEIKRMMMDRDYILNAVRASFQKHGDCDSGTRYNGVPRACTACMATIKLKEMLNEWKGGIVRLSAIAQGATEDQRANDPE